MGGYIYRYTPRRYAPVCITHHWHVAAADDDDDDDELMTMTVRDA